MLASVLSGTTPLPAFSQSGYDTGFEKRCGLGCVEELVLSFNSALRGFLSDNDSFAEPALIALDLEQLVLLAEIPAAYWC